jgi:hypothetical protein
MACNASPVAVSRQRFGQSLMPVDVSRWRASSVGDRCRPLFGQAASVDRRAMRRSRAGREA